jgi:CheY-like chemotaxis protein
MIMTINRCIDYAKATKGIKLVPHIETIDLQETMQLPLTCMRNVQDRISIDMDPMPVDVCSHVITDKQWLQENLLCLLSNAVKYSSQGNVKLTVSLKNRSLDSQVLDKVEEFSHRIKTSHPSDQQTSEYDVITPSQSQVLLLFEVEDNGIGVPPELMDALFQPFKQTQRLAGGTGLGLYSLAKRIEAIHGEYGVRSRRDGSKGSLFWFTIPYRPDEVSAAAAQLSAENVDDQFHDPVPVPVSVPGQGGALDNSVQLSNVPPDTTKSKVSQKSIQSNNKAGLQILLVDDSLPILKMTSMLLKKSGHVVTTAENGEVALKVVEDRWFQEQDVFDVILMDLQMPVMDGLEATKRLRQLEMTRVSANLAPRQVIIGVSANSDNDAALAAFDHGINAFIAKPFSTDTFNRTLRSVIEKAKHDAVDAADFDADVNESNESNIGWKLDEAHIPSLRRRERFLQKQF